MLPNRLRRPLFLSPIAAILAQLLLSAAVAAATGGGDFPKAWSLLAIL